MYCSKCGNVLDEVTHTCTKCDKELGKEPVKPSGSIGCLGSFVVFCAIVLLVAAIAVPNWYKRQLKSRQFEGRINL